MPPTTAARPKRAAEEFARSHDPDETNNNNNSAKKPRFDHRNPSTLAPDAREEDLILDADVIGKSGAQTKRNAVNIDGYESDSENDNFEARARARANKKAKKEKEKENGGDEDEDMFADADLQEDEDEDEDEDEGGGGKKKKEVKFLEPSDIEGQVMNSTSGGHVSSEILLNGNDHDHDKRNDDKGKRRATTTTTKDEESESSSGDEHERDQLPEEIEDEDAQELGAGSKKRHAPRLDAFNLKEEEEEGRYDESGNYVRKATDPDAVNDNWLEGLSKRDMKRAREAQEKREDERRRKMREDDAVLMSDLLSRLIGELEVGETALEALQRLNKGRPNAEKKKKKVPRWKFKKGQQDTMDVDGENGNGNGHTHAVDPKEEARRKAVEAITGAADALYSRGQHEIYEAERELLMRQYKRETGEEWTSRDESVDDTAGAGHDAETSMWVYRWSDARDGGEAHGPYDGSTMKAWNDAGYFGEGVEFQRVGDEGWSRLLDVTS